MKAIVIGATGLVGKSIVQELLEDNVWSSISTFSRRSLPIEHAKLHQNIVDFEKMPEWQNRIQGDVLFSALGTTIKAAGSKEAQYRIDHDYQYDIAKAALQNGAKTLVIISSVNADSGSKIFYLRMKGELEDKLKKLSFSSLNILRPGPLKGERSEKRTSEIVYQYVLESLPESVVPYSMRPIEARKVALRAVESGRESKAGIHTLLPRDLF